MGHLQSVKFVVDEKPYCLWDWDVRKLNLEFIETLDPDYFKSMAKMLAQNLEGEERQYAAISLRNVYSHGLETLMALICASIQAPFCVIGWFLKYQNNNLVSVVKKINECQELLSALEHNPIMTWEGVADTLLIQTNDHERDQKMRRKFADLWRKFAKDFLDIQMKEEYNSIKHGFRIGIGGFALAFGFEVEPGVPAPKENMRTVVNSEYGSSYYFTERLKDARNFRVKRQSLNWNPENYIYGLYLISVSMANIISHLKILQGIDPSKVVFCYPTDDSSFDLPWQIRPGFSNFTMNSVIEENWISPYSAQEILNAYVQDDKNDSDKSYSN